MDINLRKQCPICLEKLNPFSLGIKSGYNFVACQACGSVMTNPEVTEDVLRVFLNESQLSPTHLPHPKSQIIWRTRLLKKITRRSADISTQSFLDVSAMHGYAVAAANEIGFAQVKGIDTRDFFIRFAKDNYGMDKFENISVMDYARTGAQADVIFCAEGFSTQIDIETYTSALSKLLKPNGVLYIEDINGNSAWLPRAISKWGFAIPPLNSLYPSHKGMEKLLARHGLKIKKKYWSFNPYMRLLVTK